MAAVSNASSALAALSDRLLERLKAAQGEVGPELETRLRALAEATASYFLDGMGGTASPEDGKILEARAAALEAAGIQAVSHTLQATLKDITLSAIQIVFAVL